MVSLCLTTCLVDRIVFVIFRKAGCVLVRLKVPPLVTSAPAPLAIYLVNRIFSAVLGALRNKLTKYFGRARLSLLPLGCQHYIPQLLMCARFLRDTIVLDRPVDSTLTSASPSLPPSLGQLCPAQAGSPLSRTSSIGNGRDGLTLVRCAIWNISVWGGPTSRKGE